MKSALIRATVSVVVIGIWPMMAWGQPGPGAPRGEPGGYRERPRWAPPARGQWRGREASSFRGEYRGRGEGYDRGFRGQRPGFAGSAYERRGYAPQGWQGWRGKMRGPGREGMQAHRSSHFGMGNDRMFPRWVGWGMDGFACRDQYRGHHYRDQGPAYGGPQRHGYGYARGGPQGRMMGGKARESRQSQRPSCHGMWQERSTSRRGHRDGYGYRSEPGGRWDKSGHGNRGHGPAYQGRADQRHGYAPYGRPGGMDRSKMRDSMQYRHAPRGERWNDRQGPQGRGRGGDGYGERGELRGRGESRGRQGPEPTAQLFRQFMEWLQKEKANRPQASQAGKPGQAEPAPAPSTRPRGEEGNRFQGRPGGGPAGGERGVGPDRRGEFQRRFDRGRGGPRQEQDQSDARENRRPRNQDRQSGPDNER